MFVLVLLEAEYSQTWTTCFFSFLLRWFFGCITRQITPASVGRQEVSRITVSALGLARPCDHGCGSPCVSIEPQCQHHYMCHWANEKAVFPWWCYTWSWLRLYKCLWYFLPNHNHFFDLCITSCVGRPGRSLVYYLGRDTLEKLRGRIIRQSFSILQDS